MDFRGRVIITNEAVEVYKVVNLFLVFNVKASWDRENKLLKVT